MFPRWNPRQFFKYRCQASSNIVVCLKIVASLHKDRESMGAGCPYRVQFSSYTSDDLECILSTLYSEVYVFGATRLQGLPTATCLSGPFYWIHKVYSEFSHWITHNGYAKITHSPYSQKNLNNSNGSGILEIVFPEWKKVCSYIKWQSPCRDSHNQKEFLKNPIFIRNKGFL